MGLQGNGTTITFGTSGYSTTVQSFDGFSIKRGSVDMTHLESTDGKDFDPEDLYEVEMSLTVDHTPETLPPVATDSGKANETISVNWAGLGAGYIWSVSGHMTSYDSSGAKVNERMVASVTIKGSGKITKS